MQTIILMTSILIDRFSESENFAVVEKIRDPRDPLKSPLVLQAPAPLSFC